MTTLSKCLLILGGLLLQSQAFAQYESTSSSEINYFATGPRGFKSFVRVSPIIGASGFELLTGGASTESTQSATGGILLSFGRGTLTAESGILYFQSGGDVTYQIEGGSNPNANSNFNPALVDNGELADAAAAFQKSVTIDHQLSYLGVPLIAKYSYFENRQATFFVKGGVMPALLLNARAESEKIADYVMNPSEGADADSEASVPVLSDMDVFGIVGIGGTAPMGDDRLFLLDISYFRGFMPIVPDSSYFNQGFALSVGMTFDL